MTQQFPAPSPQAQQQFYTQQGISDPNLSPTVTMLDWFIFFILSWIPLVNLIMLIVFACDSSKPSRANFCRVALVFMVISFIIIFIAITILFGSFASVLNSLHK